MLSMLSALELLLFSLSFGGGLMLKEYILLIPKVQYWKPVPHLAGEGEWLREVEERAGESKRALWVISRVLKCNLMVCVDVAPSYLRIRRPINKFGKILFQAVEILTIRMGWKLRICSTTPFSCPCLTSPYHCWQIDLQNKNVVNIKFFWSCLDNMYFSFRWTHCVV